jgi:hypothetical protein
MRAEELAELGDDRVRATRGGQVHDEHAGRCRSGGRRPRSGWITSTARSWTSSRVAPIDASFTRTIESVSIRWGTWS